MQSTDSISPLSARQLNEERINAAVERQTYLKALRVIEAAERYSRSRVREARAYIEYYQQRHPHPSN